MPALLIALGLSACAGKEELTNSLDKDLVLQSMVKIDQQQQDTKLKTDKLDQRVLALEKQLAEQQAGLEAMLATLKAQVLEKKAAAPSDMQKHQASSIQAHKTKHAVMKKNVRKNLVKKLAKIESSIQLSEEPMMMQSDDDKLKEKNRYTAAYLALKSGRYDEAEQAFSNLLAHYPKGEYADQAYYWLGESLLAKGKFKPAAKAFLSLSQNYPSSSKYQAGLLKLAVAYQQASKIGDAKAVLQRLIKEFPGSRSSERARSRLAKLSAAQ